MATVVIVIFRIIVFLGRRTGRSQALSGSDYHVLLYCIVPRKDEENIYLNLLISHGHDLSIFFPSHSCHFSFSLLSFKSLSLIIFHFSFLLPF